MSRHNDAVYNTTATNVRCQTSNFQNGHHTSPSQASLRVSFVSSLEKNDRVMYRLLCHVGYSMNRNVRNVRYASQSTHRDCTDICVYVAMTARLYEIIYLAFEQKRCELYFYTYHNILQFNRCDESHRFCRWCLVLLAQWQGSNVKLMDI